MGNVQFYNSKVLFSPTPGAKVAMHTDCCCCVLAPYHCDACINSPNTPNAFRVVIAGMGGGCGSCSDLDGTFVATNLGTVPGKCEWRYNYPSKTCDVDYLYVLLWAGNIEVGLAMAGEPDSLRIGWNDDTLDATYNCLTIGQPTPRNIPYWAQNWPNADKCDDVTPAPTATVQSVCT